MKPARFTGAAAEAKIKAVEREKRREEKALAAAAAAPATTDPKPPPRQPFQRSYNPGQSPPNENDETLYYLKEMIRDILMHQTASKTISLSLQELYNIDISELMRQCKIQTPIELFKHMGFTFDEYGCFKSYESESKS
uniref:Uncharacterized protein n=1 Tax=Panagrolaimus davidi TaxID=227884 RepID=A0A914PTY1_9BILA